MMAKRARRGRGEGSVFQRKDGRWVGRLTIGYDAAGKRVRKTVYGKSKTEALEKLTRLRSTTTGGVVARASGTTLADWIDHWADTKQGLRPVTLADYRTVATKHVVPFLGGLRIDRVSARHIRTWLTSCEERGIGRATQRRAYQLLRMTLQLAVNDHAIAMSPLDSVDPPKYRPPTMRFLEAEQAAALVEACRDHRVGSIATLAVTTGMRVGEILALQWEDVDLSEGRLTVRHTLSRGTTLGPPKTESSRRTIVLPTVALDALRRRQAHAMREGHASVARIHVTRTGSPIDKGSYHRAVWSPLRERLGLDVRFHDLRHTAASLLLCAGVPVLTVSKMLGHSSAAMTLDRYGHVLAGQEERAAAAMDAVLAG